MVASLSSTARLWGGVLLVTLGLSLAGCGGCGSEPQEQSDQKKTEREQQEPKTPEEEDVEVRREAYGLPFPPSVLSIKDREEKVLVQTDMSLEQLEAFFEARLTDYELIRPGHQLRAVGLRDYMPQLYAYASGRRRHTVVYLPADDPPEEAEEDGDRVIKGKAGPNSQAKKGRATQSKPLHTRKKGDPVTDLTEDGKPLAPGARWGEPYTPPKGSPLDKKRFRSNFGRPYGEWTLH